MEMKLCGEGGERKGGMEVIEGLGKRGLVGRVVVVLKPRATWSREQPERGWETVKAA